MEMENESTFYDDSVVEEPGIMRNVLVSGDKYLLISKWCLYVLAFLAPIFFLPFTAAPLFAKETVSFILAAVALIGWLAHFLATGVIAYKKSWLNVVLAALFLVGAISAFRSQSFFASVWGPDVTGEKLISLVTFLALYFLTGALLKKNEITGLLGVVYASLLLAGIISLLQMLGWAYVFPFDFTKRPDFNTIGTVNALAVFYGMFFVLGVGILLSMKRIAEEVRRKRLFRWTVVLSTVVLLANILVVSLPRVTSVGGFTVVSKFTAVWFGIGFAMMIFLGQSFRAAYRRRMSEGSSALHFGASYYVPVLILVFSAIFYFLQTPVFGKLANGIPIEVTPAFSATMDIARQTLKANPAFGSGPATFGFDYNQYRSADINQTLFWSVKFFHGFSFLATMVATEGVAGIVAWLAFIGIALFILFRTLFSDSEFDPLRFAILGAVCFSALLLFLYASNFTALLFLFLLCGMFAARSVAHPTTGSGWVIAPRSVSAASPAFMFVSSLVAIFLIVAGIIGVYFSAEKYFAEAYFNSGVRIFNLTGNADNAEAQFARALAIDQQSDAYLRADGQMRIVKMQQAVGRALRGEQNTQAEFQASFSAARDAIVAATKVNPQEPQNWSLEGLLYENLIPFIAGADQLAVNAYREAAHQDPVNPAAFLDLGRAFVESADAVQVRIGQINDRVESLRLTAQRTDYLNQAEEALNKAASLKADYAPAHFLLAQVFTRKNDLASAIKKTEDVKLLSPFDVGVAFQLGFLYYQAGTLDKAQAEFERAISLNTNYSNARYFLGLIYDRQGVKSQALDQFQKIAELNPDNQEVKTIIKNLQAGRSALSGIVPPAPAPEKRGTAPVGESRGNVVTPK